MANWAYVENNQIKELHDLLPKNWKNISGLNKSESDLEFLNTIGWYKVVKKHQEYDTSKFEVKSYSHQYNSIDVIETINLIERSAEIQLSIDDLKQNFLQELRIERNRKLSESDWTQLPDAPLENKESWTRYRQELRDLPSKYAENGILHVENVEWPQI